MNKLRESKQDDVFDSDPFQVNNGNEFNEKSEKTKMIEAQELQLKTIEEEILEKKGVF